MHHITATFLAREASRRSRALLNSPASGELGEPESEAGGVTHPMFGLIQDKTEYAK
jgi:hypothetical protein